MNSDMNFESIQEQFRTPIRYAELCFVCSIGIIIYGILLYFSLMFLFTAKHLTFPELLFISAVSLVMGWGVASSIICMLWIKDTGYDRGEIKKWISENKELINNSKLLYRGTNISIEDRIAGYNVIVCSPIPWFDQVISTRFYLLSQESTILCKIIASSITLYLGWGINPFAIATCLVCFVFNFIGGESYKLKKIIINQ
ncbi:MAG: hypothetical protein A2X48_11835 [Lentisphaerae bacterium GWF2_49_21]|nr:MAG: hypothetical protein A2X48_11835 [Lentisphaerae bacterium GWF2_49_21]